MDKGNQFAPNESTDEEAGDAKEVAAWKTLFLGNGPHGAKEHSCQKGCSRHRVWIITGQQWWQQDFSTLEKDSVINPLLNRC